MDEYIVLISRNTAELERQVNDRIKAGYVPIGGVSLNNSKAAQAMILNGPK